MVIAIVGSRDLYIEDISPYIPAGVVRIVSGGAKGIDSCAREYALRTGIDFTEYLPEYHLYQRAAPLVRSRRIVEEADEVLIFWNGKSRGTKYVIDYCEKTGKKNTVYRL